VPLVAHTRAGVGRSGIGRVQTEGPCRPEENRMTYRFASAAQRDLFTAESHKASIDSQAFEIIGARLYLYDDRAVWTLFKKDPASCIHKPEANWPMVQEQPDPAHDHGWRPAAGNRFPAGVKGRCNLPWAW
jgi:hypothetical protein